MLIRRRRGWELPESRATNETAFWNRRRLIQGIAAGPILASGIGALPALAADADPSAGLYPGKRNERYTLDRPVTDEKYSTTYNNFYEFGTDKGIWRDAQALKIRPWTIKLDGMVENRQTLDFDDLLKKVSLEERLYRHRCVEAWSMAVPWYGFPMKDFVEFCQPKSTAKYVVMQTIADKGSMPGLRSNPFWPWPYTEGLTMAEANNELAFMVTG